MNLLVKGLLAASLLIAAPISAMANHEDCQSVNAVGTVGYVNVREYPSLNASVLVRWSNPERGSDWGAGKYCYEESWDGERMWSKVYLDMKDGSYYEGWVSDKVLEFLD